MVKQGNPLFKWPLLRGGKDKEGKEGTPGRSGGRLGDSPGNAFRYVPNPFQRTSSQGASAAGVLATSVRVKLYGDATQAMPLL
jgi:hypothetical protein